MTIILRFIISSFLMKAVQCSVLIDSEASPQIWIVLIIWHILALMRFRSDCLFFFNGDGVVAVAMWGKLTMWVVLYDDDGNIDGWLEQEIKSIWRVGCDVLNSGYICEAWRLIQRRGYCKVGDSEGMVERYDGNLWFYVNIEAPKQSFYLSIVSFLWPYRLTRHLARTTTETGLLLCIAT